MTMDNYQLAKLALIQSLIAEIEGMKAENAQREILGQSMAYVYDDFALISDQLKSEYIELFNR